jgi:ribulose-bisphosphate carboxylase large chain
VNVDPRAHVRSLPPEGAPAGRGAARRQAGTLQATYVIETPHDPAKVAEVLAGEQSSGTFVRVAGETDDLRARSRATVDHIEELEAFGVPSLPNALLTRQGRGGPYRRARITVSFPLANIGNNLPTLAATVAGNLYDLGETTGVRLERLQVPQVFRDRFERPRHGVAGTRAITGVEQGPLVGTIIKPNVGLSAEATGALVGQLCEAGIDFVKDDEVCGNPEHAPIEQRIKAVMNQVRRWQDRTGKHVMIAFNITDEHEAMRRHAELVAREGGSCVMVGLNWCGFSSVQALRRECGDSGLAIHGHRNGYGMFSRHPALGMDFQPYQVMWRLAGVDHMHVHGLQGKFSQADEEVIASAHDCLAPLAEGDTDAVMPAFSSGQWAGTLPATLAVVPSGDLLFMAGGGILAHPGGPAAGVTSLRQAWAAVRNGESLATAARHAPELQAALGFFGR